MPVEIWSTNNKYLHLNVTSLMQVS